MLITTPEELQKYLPSSVYEAADSLVGLSDRAERRHLVPVLGDKLYNHICELYTDGEMTATETKLLNLCQSAVAYFTVADNADILSLSFNMGNGLAQVNTDGYTAASEESLKRYISTAWHQARQDIDDICHLLEDIATATVPSSSAAGSDATVPEGSPSGNDSTLIELWRSSDWFYLQGDLLLATCRETKRYILADEQPFSYMEYVKLQGELRTRQEANIAPEIGDELTSAMVRTQYESGVFPNADQATVSKVLNQLRLSLMSFVRWSRTDKPKYENDAKMFLFRAMEIIKLDQKKFMPYIESSPLYVAPKPEGEEVEDKERLFFGSASDSIFNPFGV